MNRGVILGWLLFLLAACGMPQAGAPQAPTTGSALESGTDAALSGPPAKLRLATTTSTADSGLLDAILPDFEQRYHADVEVIAVGTGQALKLGEQGDVDVVLVHARQQEDEFIAKGFGINRHDVMYNDFVIVGPGSDPAHIGGAQRAAAAFKQIAESKAVFASRGDASGTYVKEQAIWASSGITPTAELGWYKSLGQGMGETLIAADELGAYTLADRGTYVSMRDKLPGLQLLFGGATVEQNPDPTLYNPYGVIQINPAKHPGVHTELGALFINWLVSPEVQQRIGSFGKDRFGQPLFYPQAAP